ncbi:MAG: rRNA maturation RNase YbeY [Acidithiobacillus sp.]|nr:rRNA maturation RNase YbeY [Acidithiobacillus sp.]
MNFWVRWQYSDFLEPALRARIPQPRSLRPAIALGLGLSLDPGPWELSVQWLHSSEIAALNGQYRHQPKPTNCLSFPAPMLPHQGRRRPLGDIALAPEIILAEAQSQGKRPLDHYRHLLLHSTLHLLGYDHETKAEAARMEALEIELLAQLGVADPYQLPDYE